MSNKKPENLIHSREEKMKTAILLQKIERVKELMEKNELDIYDDLLFLKVMTIYVEAQLDQIRESKDKK
jgi:hypothetical protein